MGGKDLSQLGLGGRVHGVLRTQRRQHVGTTIPVVLRRLADDVIFTGLLDQYVYATPHHYRPKSEHLDWALDAAALLPDIVGEDRCSLTVKGSASRVSLHLQVNCEDEIVQEKVDGKRRKVPKASQSSLAAVAVSADRFIVAEFAEAYLSLLGDLFDLIAGHYGWAEHGTVKHGNDYDRIHANLFEPEHITWANFFGPALVERIGSQRFLSAPAYSLRELPGGGIVLTTAANPLQQLEPEVQERIAHVKAHLGITSPSERATPQELADFQARSAASDAAMRKRVEEAFQQARAQTAAEMQRQAEGCVQGTAQFWGERLDFRPESLETLDRVIASGFGPNEEPETIETAVQAFGAYVGEVVRRHLGGVWHDEEMKGQPVLLQVGPRKERVEPFKLARRRFQERGSRDGFSLYGWLKTNLG